jgi:hypothetical protein
LQFLARNLAGAADGFSLFSRSLFGGLLVMFAKLHLSEDALALHFLLQDPEGLVDIIVSDENLHAVSLFRSTVVGPRRSVWQGQRAVSQEAQDYGAMSI